MYALSLLLSLRSLPRDPIPPCRLEIVWHLSWVSLEKTTRLFFSALPFPTSRHAGDDALRRPIATFLSHHYPSMMWWQKQGDRRVPTRSAQMGRLRRQCRKAGCERCGGPPQIPRAANAFTPPHCLSSLPLSSLGCHLLSTGVQAPPRFPLLPPHPPPLLLLHIGPTPTLCAWYRWGSRNRERYTSVREPPLCGREGFFSNVNTTAPSVLRPFYPR